MYLVFTFMPGESYIGQLRSLFGFCVCVMPFKRELTPMLSFFWGGGDFILINCAFFLSLSLSLSLCLSLCLCLCLCLSLSLFFFLSKSWLNQPY